jgi:D-alanyl-D-alanine carboxypeptidase
VRAASWAIAGALLIGGCHSTPPARNQALEPALQAVLDGVRETHHLPGISGAVVLADGGLHVAAAGFADVEQRLPMSASAVMPAGSIGKQFVSLTALSLEHEGRVDLDAPIEKLFADAPWFEHVPNAHALTLRLLLKHRGGLGDHRESERFVTEIRKHLDAVPYDPDFRITPEELVAIELDTAPLFAPDASMRYSETGYILAGMALERACRCRYYEEVTRRILEPLSLAHTSPAVSRSVPGLAQGYIGEAIPFFPATTLENGSMRFSPATEWTGGGLYSNAIDLARWSKALYEGRALPTPYLDELLASGPGEERESMRYGMGVYILRIDGERAYGHGGEFPGYYSYTCYFPDHRIAIAVQTNTAATDVQVVRNAVFALLRATLEQQQSNARPGVS